MKKLLIVIFSLIIGVGLIFTPAFAETSYARNVFVCLWNDTDRDGTKDGSESWVTFPSIQQYVKFHATDQFWESTAWAGQWPPPPSGCRLYMGVSNLNTTITVKVPTYADNCIYWGGQKGNELSIVMLAGSSNEQRNFGYMPESGGSC